MIELFAILAIAIPAYFFFKVRNERLNRIKKLRAFYWEKPFLTDAELESQLVYDITMGHDVPALD